MDQPQAIQPGTWPQVAVVGVFLLLWALPTIAINPTLRKNGHKLLAYAIISTTLAGATALTALDMDTYAGLAALGLLVYVLFIGTGLVASIKARHQHHGIRKQAERERALFAKGWQS